jgi:hypothetical protein
VQPPSLPDAPTNAKESRCRREPAIVRRIVLGMGRPGT